MSTAITYFLFLIGFFFLVKGADFMVNGASAIAKRLKISDLVIGLTVVAFGTSTPELFVNIVASTGGNSEIAVGNVLGSNICNVFLILGICAIIYPLSVSAGTVWKEIPFSLLAVIVLGVMVNDQMIDGAGSSLLTRIDGLVLLAFFTIFLYYTFSIAKAIDGMDDYLPAKTIGIARSLLLVIAGLIGLTLGGKWIVDGAVLLAKSFGMSESLVGLTIVAVGTSLPELATSAMAAYKKNVEIAVGNVVGSNIFNIFFALGISATIKPLPIQAKSNLDIGVVILSGLLLFLFMFTGKKRSLDRWEGIVSLALYGGYIAYLVLDAGK
ncbi:sodium:proton exchanger [Alkalispirochaeta odontotermitis]|nr:sodium:proton exchanger [Alkalispirochaeta odontotermitis]CAB1075954.1 Inner membrane protein YrbG, predicted calcium/sodium:proton antiporter [Olavius algarvensis Delta 1 endosymbiont]